MGLKLVVSNLATSVNNLRIEQLFAVHGRVASAQIVWEQHGGEKVRRAYVQMSTDAESHRAIAGLHGHVIDGMPLEINTTSTEPQDTPVYIRPAYGNGRSGGGGVRSGRRN